MRLGKPIFPLSRPDPWRFPTVATALFCGLMLAFVVGFQVWWLVQR